MNKFFFCSILMLLVLASCGSTTSTETLSGPVGIGVRPSATKPLAKTYFVYAKLMDTVGPVERGSKYEDPLQTELSKLGLGEITGGGTMAEKGIIKFIGIDIELANLDSALEVVRKKLLECGAPKGSVLEFMQDGKSITVPIHPQD